MKAENRCTKCSHHLNTVQKLNLQLLFTKSHNPNTRGHSGKVVGKSIKQVKGSIFKQQVVIAATRATEADSISKPRRGFDNIQDSNKSLINIMAAPCRGVLTSCHGQRRARGESGTESSPDWLSAAAPAAAGDPARARQIPALSRERTRFIICPFQTESYVVLYLTWKSSSSYWELYGTQHLMRSGPDTAAPLTPKARETLRMP